MAKIKTLKDKGEVFYPQTHIEAVVDDNGNTVTGLIDEISREIAPLETEVEKLGNKVAELEKLSGGSGADIPLATTENDGLMSAEDKKYTLSLIDKTVTLVSSGIYESLNLGYIIHKGASVHIEGDFKLIVCRTNPSDTEYQTISGDGIADRDITHIKMGGVGTATMTIKGVIWQKLE